MNIDGVPVRIMILKADGTSQDASASPDSSGTSSKWLGFAKTLAWNCLQRSKKSHSWVSETRKLPSATSTTGSTTTSESDKLSFVLVKCHADQRLCLIIIRSIDPQPGIHGIILNPCSSLSPDGFGKPLIAPEGFPAVDLVWGTPGVADNHRLELTGYVGARDGVGTQGLLTYESWSDDPNAPPVLSPRFQHGEEWFKHVKVDKPASQLADYAVGGFLGVPLRIVEGDVSPKNVLKSSVKVFSTSGHWLPEHRAYFSANQYGQIEINPTASSFPGGVDFNNLRADGLLYCNGKPWVFTSGSQYYILGVGFKDVTVEDVTTRKMLLVARFDDAFHVLVADSPYKVLHSIHSFSIASSDLRSTMYPSFFFNESGSSAIAVVVAPIERSTDFSAPVTVYESAICRVSVDQLAETAEAAMEFSEGCMATTTTGSDRVRTGPAAVATTSSNDVSYTTTMPVAAGFDGDTEKVLYAEITFEATSHGESGYYETYSVSNKSRPAAVDVIVNGTETTVYNGQVLSSTTFGGRGWMLAPAVQNSYDVFYGTTRYDYCDISSQLSSRGGSAATTERTVKYSINAEQVAEFTSDSKSVTYTSYHTSGLDDVHNITVSSIDWHLTSDLYYAQHFDSPDAFWEWLKNQIQTVTWPGSSCTKTDMVSAPGTAAGGGAAGTVITFYYSIRNHGHGGFPDPYNLTASIKNVAHVTDEHVSTGFDSYQPTGGDSPYGENEEPFLIAVDFINDVLYYAKRTSRYDGLVLNYSIFANGELLATIEGH